MIDLVGIVGIPFLKKIPFTGSHKHMCYRLEKWSEQDSTSLAATVWLGPACYEKTSDERKRRELFLFTEEGLLQAVDWMNEQSLLDENQKIC